MVLMVTALNWKHHSAPRITVRSFNHAQFSLIPRQQLCTTHTRALASEALQDAQRHVRDES